MCAHHRSLTLTIDTRHPKAALYKKISLIYSGLIVDLTRAGSILLV